VPPLFCLFSCVIRPHSCPPFSLFFHTISPFIYYSFTSPFVFNFLSLVTNPPFCFVFLFLSFLHYVSFHSSFAPPTRIFVLSSSHPFFSPSL
jgi:hypothetical protein